MGWSIDREEIRTLFDRDSKHLKQFELSGPRRERVVSTRYELAARDNLALIETGALEKFL